MGGELTLDFHDLALAVILGIAGLVAPAFVYRLRAPVSHTLLEHENLETAWTLGPIFVLVGLAVPSLQLLYTIDDRAGGVMVGISEAWDRYIGVVRPRLLMGTSAPTLHSGRTTANITRTDVLHRFAVPALATKADAVPGRLT